MCGIAGSFNTKYSFKIIKSALLTMQERGRDGCGYFDGDLNLANHPEDLPESNEENILAHNLHSIVNAVPQPLRADKAVLVSNCEIYNWEQLCEKHKITARNDSDLILKLINKIGIKKALEELRGTYAFAYWKDNDVYLARDILGIKPLWYYYDEELIFSSERKAIDNKYVEELNPRKIIKYNLLSKKLLFIDREFFKLSEPITNEQEILIKLKELITESVKIRIPPKKFALLFSGGLDSVIIAKVLKDLNQDFVCYTAATSEDSPDLIAAQKASTELQIPLQYRVISRSQTQEYLKKIVPLIEDNNVTKVGVALPLFIASEMARKDGCKVIFSGAGADELFGGYNRYKKSQDLTKLNKDCYSDLLKIYEKNTYRDDVVTMNNNLELRVPFLDKELISYALNIDPNLKIKEDVEKYILRKLALSIGISEDLAMRKKKAAQYGSGFDKMLETLSSEEKKYKSKYLEQYYTPKNLRLGALVSSGKDSIFAMYTMLMQNYEISCMLTMLPENPDSYMFQSQATEMVDAQSKCIGIPLVTQYTSGKKEYELRDLKKLLFKAKKQYKIEGIVTGAIHSEYQRTRIEKVCDSLSLKIFSPLWHFDPEKEIREILNKGFKFTLVKVAAYGLTEQWLGKIVNEDDIKELLHLHKTFGMNIAFEGGEAETLVLDGPIFKSKIVLEEVEKKMENNFTGVLNIKKFSIVEK